MQVTVSFKNMENSPAVQSYACEKIGELVEKIARHPRSVFLIFETNRHLHTLRCCVATADIGYFYTHTDSSSFFAAVDKTYEKLKLQLGKRKLTHKDWQRKFARRKLQEQYALVPQNGSFFASF